MRERTVCIRKNELQYTLTSLTRQLAFRLQNKSLRLERYLKTPRNTTCVSEAVLFAWFAPMLFVTEANQPIAWRWIITLNWF